MVAAVAENIKYTCTIHSTTNRCGSFSCSLIQLLAAYKYHNHCFKLNLSSKPPASVYSAFLLQTQNSNLITEMAEPQLVPSIAALAGLVPTVLGINAIFRPRSALRVIDFPVPKDAESQKLVDNLMLMYGARDLAVGLPILLAWYFDRRALGWLMIVNAIIPCVDAWAARRQAGKGEWMHLPFVALGVGLGAALLK